MRKLFNYIALLSISLLLVVSCNGERGEKEGGRALLLYMAANNDLSPYAQRNLNSIKEGYLPNKGSRDVLLIYYHTDKGAPQLIRVYEEKGEAVEEMVVQFPNQSSVASSSLKEALLHMEALYPNREYGAILWSHGTGWLPEGYYHSGVMAGDALPHMAPLFEEDPYKHMVKSFGLESKKEMEIMDLVAALPYHLSFIIFDACLMGGVEVAYQLRGRCDYIVASPTEILVEGFPYHSIMEPLFASGKANLERVVELYYHLYQNQSGLYQSGTIALVKTEHFNELAAAVAPLFERYDINLVDISSNSLQPYFRDAKRNWFWDLGSVVEAVATEEEIATFKRALDRVVIAKYHTDRFLNISIENFSGLSCYVPIPSQPKLNNFYSKFDWSRDGATLFLPVE